MKFLIVDDDLSAHLALKQILGPYGECVSAYTAKEGYDRFTAAQAGGDPFRLVCLEIILPGESGLELLKRLREWEKAAGAGTLNHATVIISSYLTDSRNVLQGFQFGCGAFIPKPVDSTHLLYELKRLGVVADDYLFSARSPD